MQDVEPTLERSMSLGVLDAEDPGVHRRQEGAGCSRRGRGAAGRASQKKNSQGLVEEKRSNAGWFNTDVAMEGEMSSGCQYAIHAPTLTAPQQRRRVAVLDSLFQLDWSRGSSISKFFSSNLNHSYFVRAIVS